MGRQALFGDFDGAIFKRFNTPDGSNPFDVGLPQSVVGFIDFTNKPDGLPPSKLDTGQPVDYTFNASGRHAVISGGRLVVKDQAIAGAGGLADYYQSDLGADVTRVGVEFTMPAGVDDGNGNMTYAAWDGYYEGGGTKVPRSWCHMSIIPGTGEYGVAKFFVCNGVGNLFVIKQQSFRNPPADGITPWFCESILDVDSGCAYSFLPDGSMMTATNADIAFMCGVLSIPVFTFADLQSKVIMCEHFCTTGANAAKFAGFKSMYGETSTSEPRRASASTLTPRYAAFLVAGLKNAIPPSAASISHSPSDAVSAISQTAATNVDSLNGRVSTTAGPNGKVIFVVSAYYEFTEADTLFWRLAGTVNTATRAAFVGNAGQKVVVSQTIEVSGLKPGQAVQETLQHWTVKNGSAVCKAGGSGGSMLPPITLIAIPA